MEIIFNFIFINAFINKLIKRKNKIRKYGGYKNKKETKENEIKKISFINFELAFCFFILNRQRIAN